MRSTPRIAILFLSFLIIGCAQRIEIVDGSGSITGGSGEVQTKTFALTGPKGNLISNGMELMELARISSPDVSGTIIQATDVAFSGNLLFAVYNTRGDEYRGALQVIDVSDPENPQILQEARLLTSEANRIQIQGEYIYVAGGDLLMQAVLDTFRYSNGKLEHLAELDLPSFQTTMLQITGDHGYAITGDDGGVVRLDLSNPGNPQAVNFMPFDDARYIEELNGNEFVAVSGGALGRVIRQPIPAAGDPWAAPSAEITLTGATVGAPSWGKVVGNSLYVSADEAGVMAFSLEGGGIDLKKVIPTEGDANGLEISSDRKIAFLANGQEGLVAVDVQDANTSKMLAQYDVEDSGSANAVAYSHDLMALADGLGGVKLFRYNYNQVPGRLVTMLLTFSNPGIPEATANMLSSQAVNWTTPQTPSRVLVVRDDFHNGEFAQDTQYVVDLLRNQGYEVDFMEEPKSGIVEQDVAGYDVIWFANPGWPLDDRSSFDTLVGFSNAGGGVILQGDDMTWSSKKKWKLNPLTYLDYKHNGTKFCGKRVDNNNGAKYRVTFESNGHPVIAGLEGTSFTYGDDIDHSVPLGLGEQVLAWATLDGDPNCTLQSPVVVAFSPEPTP